MARPVDRKVRVAVVGATGVTGQQFLAALADHPLLHVTHLAASARSAGKRYLDAIRQPSGQVSWYSSGGVDPRLGELMVEQADAFDASQVDLVFTCMDAAPSRELEPIYARHAPVISTASAFRMEEGVPILIPGNTVKAKEDWNPGRQASIASIDIGQPIHHGVFSLLPEGGSADEGARVRGPLSGRARAPRRTSLYRLKA